MGRKHHSKHHNSRKHHDIKHTKEENTELINDARLKVFFNQLQQKKFIDVNSQKDASESLEANNYDEKSIDSPNYEKEEYCSQYHFSERY